jgi:hypothetical protein
MAQRHPTRSASTTRLIDGYESAEGWEPAGKLRFSMKDLSCCTRWDVPYQRVPIGRSGRVVGDEAPRHQGEHRVYEGQ